MTDDDRVACRNCCLVSIGKSRCMEHDCATDLDLPRRCLEYIPNVSDQDQRSGRTRWPDLTKQIELARAEDQAFFKSSKERGKKSPKSQPKRSQQRLA